MEGLGIIIAIVGVGMSMVGVMLALFLWNRGEANSDRRHHMDSIDRIRDDLDKMYWRINKLNGRK